MQNQVIIYGNGMMARAMRTALVNIHVAIFAAGVSNSNESNLSQYNREIDELYHFIKKNNSAKIVYFSSYVAENGDSLYAQHKRKIESFILNEAKDYLILRLPQVVGITSNQTLVHFFVKCAVEKKEIFIFENAFRSLIDIDDVVRIFSLLCSKNACRDIISVGPLCPISIIEIINYIESIVGFKIEKKLTKRGDYQYADITKLLDLIGKDDRIFSANYQYLVLKKYISIIAAKDSLVK